jgi:hypothetical protein
MGSEILRAEHETAPSLSAEVEFALVLSRMIDSVKSDPEHLRATVYELARHKLKEEFGSDKNTDMRQLSKSLEVAIQGVETFVSKNDRMDAWLVKPALAPPTPHTLAVASALQGGAPFPAEPVIEAVSRPTYYSAIPLRASRFTGHWRLALVIGLALVVIFAVKQHVIEVDTLRKGVGQLVGLPSAAPPKPAQVASFHERAGAAFEAPAADPLIPTTYGIYAVSGGKLFELDLLPGRAPDIRVAISPAIVRPSRTTLPDGHVKFIVYRRDSATYAADRAEIRVIARVAQEMNFDKSGKPVMNKVDDTWVMRNISTPLRTAPKRDNPDMYEVLSGDAETALAPGRYALVLKGQAYDFNVGGSITDPKQCLERMVATNGLFYSECQKH